MQKPRKDNLIVHRHWQTQVLRQAMKTSLDLISYPWLARAPQGQTAVRMEGTPTSALHTWGGQKGCSSGGSLDMKLYSERKLKDKAIRPLKQFLSTDELLYLFLFFGLLIVCVCEVVVSPPKRTELIVGVKTNTQPLYS